MTDATQPTPQAEPRKRIVTGRRVAIAAVAVAALTAAGVGIVHSQQPYGYGPWGGHHHQFAPGYGPGPDYGSPMMRQGMPGGGWMMGFGPERMFDMALSSVGASSEQKLKIVTIAQAAMQDLRPLRDRRYAASLKLAILLKADTVDKAAIEKLRSEEFAALEAGSKRASQAVGEAAEALSPSQRQQLVERWENRRRWFSRG
jgi:periplasmic protein CpxP/Spy